MIPPETPAVKAQCDRFEPLFKVSSIDESDLAAVHVGPEAEAVRRGFENLGMLFAASLLAGGVGGIRAKTSGERFTPNPNAAVLAVLPVYETDIPSIYQPVEDPELVDFIAWRIDEPARWYFRTGNYPAFLNIENAEAQWFARESLKLYSSPYAWLLGGCDGAVVLDWRRARPLVSTSPGIITDTVEYGDAIERMLLEPVEALPVIRVAISEAA